MESKLDYRIGPSTEIEMRFYSFENARKAIRLLAVLDFAVSKIAIHEMFFGADGCMLIMKLSLGDASREEILTYISTISDAVSHAYPVSKRITLPDDINSIQ